MMFFSPKHISKVKKNHFLETRLIRYRKIAFFADSKNVNLIMTKCIPNTRKHVLLFLALTAYLCKV